MRCLIKTLFALVAGMLGAAILTNSAIAQAPPVPQIGVWKSAWISHPGVDHDDTAVLHFRRDFELDAVPDSFFVRVSADNRYRLFVNGVSVSVGPARSDVLNWRFERVDLAQHLVAGTNRITATVWNWGKEHPTAQMSFRTGFLLEGEGHDALNTGPDWKVLHDEAYSFRMPASKEVGGYYVASPGEHFDAAKHDFDWNTASSQSAWVNAVIAGTRDFDRAVMRGSVPFGNSDSWQLVPSPLPAMQETPERFATIRRASGVSIVPEVLTGKGDMVVPANTKAVVLLDRGVLTNAYPVVISSGGAGARMTVTYSESLYDAQGRKGDRNAIEGKAIKGLQDKIILDGGENRRFQPLWWRTYRYVQLDIETADEAMSLNDIHGIFTAYPMEQNASFASDQSWIGPIWDINWRGLRLSAYDTYMDTPYWEQLQYVGDTRIEALVTLYNSGDDRLMRNALTLLDQSRTPNGLTASRYPSQESQVIPPFSLWWSSMVHDYWMHRDDPDFVAGFVPGIRGVMNWYERQIDETGLLGPMIWWNFLDWAPEYAIGMAPGSRDGNSVTLSLQFAYSLRHAADLEDRFGEPAIAVHYRALAAKLRAAARKHGWDEGRQLFADTPEKTSFSQHANVMAVLAGVVPQAEKAALMERVLADESLTQATVYYRFYVDEAMFQAGLGDRYLERLDLWQDMIRVGLTTTPESPEPTRSDSHAWASHPNYYLLSRVVGIQPASEGFKTVRVAPILGEMQHASGTIPHPLGPISVQLRRLGTSEIEADIDLPDGMTGVFAWNGQERDLSAGAQKIRLP